ncbi:hypothetical protein VZO05_08255 [Aggregatilineales bacterium SYSU G02658]
MVEKLVYDLFLADCDKHLSAGEVKLIRYYCGVDTGYPPLDQTRIGVMFGRAPDEIKLFTRRALLKLPYSRLQELRIILETPGHRYTVGLMPSERDAIKRLITNAIALQDAVRAIQQRVTQAKPSTVTPAQAPNQSPNWSSSTTAQPSLIDRLVAILETANAPQSIEQIAVMAQAQGFYVTQSQLKRTIQASSKFVWYGDQVVLLHHWRNRITLNGTVQLRLCPPLPVSPKASAEDLLEMLLLTSKWMTEKHMTYFELWEQICRHMKLRATFQDVLDLLYACGLIPDMHNVDARHRQVELALTEGDSITQMRTMMLAHVLQRIYHLTRTLSSIAYSYRPTLAQVADHTHGVGLGVADTVHRVRLLQALGAVSSHGVWEVTPAGQDALAACGDASITLPAPTLLSSSNDFDLDWFDL